MQREFGSYYLEPQIATNRSLIPQGTGLADTGLLPQHGNPNSDDLRGSKERGSPRGCLLMATGTSQLAEPL